MYIFTSYNIHTLQKQLEIQQNELSLKVEKPKSWIWFMETSLICIRLNRVKSSLPNQKCCSFFLPFPLHTIRNLVDQTYSGPKITKVSVFGMKGQGLGWFYLEFLIINPLFSLVKIYKEKSQNITPLHLPLILHLKNTNSALK